MDNRIHSIQLHNFKFFQNENPIELKGNNLLLYGENGSGKSSIYWALYTLFEASLKSEDDEIRKYFSKTIKPKDNLINIHSKETSLGSDDYNSFIELLTTDNPQVKYRISKADVAINKSDSAKFINYASDYINYRMLLSISGFRHSDDIDLFEMFVEDIFKYVQFSKVQITRDGKLKELTNAFEIWQEIEKGNEWVGNVGADEKIDIDKYKGTTEWKQFDDLVKSFNKSLKDLVDTINNISPTYFKQLGYDFEFNLNLKNEASYKEDLRSYEYIPFYELFKDGIFLVKENKQISLKDIYDKSYSTSDNKKNANFLKEILIGQTGKTLETVVKF